MQRFYRVIVLFGLLISFSLATADEVKKEASETKAPSPSVAEKQKPAEKAPADKAETAKPATDKKESAKPDTAKADPAKPDAKKDEAKPTAPKAEVKKDEAKKDGAKPGEAKKEEAEKELQAGHSQHGEIFNEGVRQAAYLMNSTGKINFPVTTKKPLAQKFIEQGIGQLFGFWYLESERSFRQAAAIDPDCAMAYWGMAMANKSNSKRGPGFLAEAVKRKEGVTDREKLYIDALDAYLKNTKDKKRGSKLTNAYENISLRYPEDIEAKAMLGLQIWLNRSSSPHSLLALDALFNEVLAANPHHPCHHFRIHMWDLDELKSKKALNSAAMCGQSAPGIAHMWHMPGHTYSKLKRYEDAAWQQESSARVDHAHMMRDGVLPDQIHNFAHNNEWLIRNLNYLGRMNDALDLAKNMIELPRHPKYNLPTRRGCSTYYGRMRLFQTLAGFELWDETIRLANTMYLEPTDSYDEQVKRLRYLGAAYFRLGNVEQGQKQLAELDKRLADETKKRDKAAEDAIAKAKKAKKNEKDTKKAGDDAKRPFASKISSLERAVNEMKGYVAAKDGKYKEALDLIKKAGSVSKTYIASLQQLNKEAAAAEKTLRDEVTSRKNQVLPMAALVEYLWNNGKKEEAEKTFGDLRKLASSANLEAPQLARLAPIAESLKYPKDWRNEYKLPADIGNRPKHDDLGPFRWKPSPSTEWALKDVNRKTIKLSDYRGKPVVVIFYLGYGCLHCAEQLQAFAPKTAEFTEAGISLVAVSTDNQDNLKLSHENYKETGAFPFPLVSDATLDVFKKYRCHDDFEKQALHGTFLIDSEGLVRWHDISYEPFNNPEFVLKEAKRLLSKPAVKVAAE